MTIAAVAKMIRVAVMTVEAITIAVIVRKMAAAGTIAAMTPAVVEARMEAEEISERKSAEP
jgi:hypothetical protein